MRQIFLQHACEFCQVLGVSNPPGRADLLSLQIIQKLLDLESIMEVDFLVLTQFLKGELHSARIIVNLVESGFHSKLLRRPFVAYRGTHLNKRFGAGRGF